MTELNFESIDLGSFGLNNEEPVEQPLKFTLSEAVKVNPDEQAQVKKLSEQSGVPSFAVENDKQAVEDQLKFEQIDFETLSKESPNTSDYLTNFENASVAHDDIENMRSIEKIFSGLGGSIKESFKSRALGFGVIGIETSDSDTEDVLSKFGINVNLGDDEFLESAKKEAIEGILTRVNESKEIREKLQPEDMNILEQGVRGGIESLADMAPGFGLMLLSGGKAAPLLATMGVQSFTGSYAEARAEGLSQEKASWFASIDAAIEVGTELIPLKTLENFITGETKGLGKKALKFAIQEMGTEQLATALQSLNSYKFGLDKQMEQAKGAEEIISIQMQRQAVTAIATVVAGGAQIGIATGINKTMESMQNAEQKKQQEYVQDQQTIDRLNDSSEKSKLKARDKESFKQFVEKADGDNNSTVFIDAAQTSMYLQEKTQEEIDADPALQILAEQVQEAAAIGGEVQVPVADFAGEIAGTEHFAALRDSMTMSEESVSPFRQEQEQVETQNFVRRMMDTAQENVSEYAEAQEIYQTVRQQLIDSGRITPQNASVMANLVPAWATAKAQRENKSVQQVYEESGLIIEGPLTGEKARLEGELDVLTQGMEYDQTGEIVTESENFKNWFGDSQVVDEAGEPLVVYHGTGEDFTEFDPDQPGDGVFYFTDSKKAAKGYGENVMSGYVNLTNPKTIDYQGEDDSGVYADIQKAQAEGHDGLIVLNTNDGVNELDQYIAFNPTQIKSVNNRGTFDPADPNILRQEDAQQETFYSQLTKSITDIKQEKAPGQQWSAMVKKLPIKKEEIEWSGIEDFLKGKKSVTKQEVLDYLDQNQVVIEDVVKTGEEQGDFKEVPVDKKTAQQHFDDEESIVNEDGIEILDQEDFNQAKEYYFLESVSTPDETKFSDYQLPGGPLSRDTEILTNSGWKRIDVVEIGDIVLSRKDDGGVLEWVPVEAKPSIFSEKLYHFKSKSVDMMVSPCHQMVVEKRVGGHGFNRRRELIRITAEDLWKTHDCRIPLTGDWQGEKTSELFGKDSGDIMEFIGWFISEGWSVTKNGKKTTLGIGQSKEKNPEKSDRIEKLLNRLGFKWNYVPSGMAYYVGIKSIPKQLKKLCHSQGNASGKFIPKELFDLDISLLERLQESLLMGDGCTSIDKKDIRKPYQVYFTISKQLSDDFQKLTLLTGSHSRITVRNKSDKQKNDLYCIGVNRQDYSTVDDAKHGIVDYNDTAFCVTVKNHAIYVRRNGIAAFTGNSNYKEVLLTLPDSEKGKPERLIKLPEGYSFSTDQMQPEGKEWSVIPPGQMHGKPFAGRHPTQEQAEEDALILINFNRDTEWRKSKQGFKSSHFEEPNILAHIRMSEREVDGKKVLHIEEVQSDWHQEGRKKGYKLPPLEKKDIRVKFFDPVVPEGHDPSVYPGHWESYDKRTGEMIVRHAGRMTKEQVLDDAIGFGAAGEQAKVPDAPFKKSWPLLTIKKMVRYAAENGFDTIAWTTGELQAERYDLSKQVDTITAEKKDGKYNVVAIKWRGDGGLGDNVINQEGLTISEVENLIGKDLAQKIENQENDYEEYSGGDLKVGGSGMKAFYDKILPSEIKKFFGKKAWGKPKIGEIEIGRTGLEDGLLVWEAKADLAAGQQIVGLKDGKRIQLKTNREIEDAFGGGYILLQNDDSVTHKLHSLEITPEMKEKALTEGLPLFQPTSPNQTGARGYYDPDNSLIRMTETSNLSTFLHEYGHFMLDMEGKGNTDMYQSINNWYKRDSGTVAKEANSYLDKKKYDAEKQDNAGTRGKVSDADVITYIDTGSTGSSSKDAAINRSIHEQFARGFETYLMEGKAPSIELKNAFATIARWLTQIYKSIRRQVNVELDNEMRQLYDRLLATEEQIAAAAARNRFEPMFTSAAMAGMTEKEFEAYKKKQEKVKDKQTETLRDELVKQLTRQTKKWWKEEKADLVREETEDIKTQKVYTAADQLKNGDIKLDFATVKEMVGEQKTDKIGRTSTRIPQKLVGMTAKEHQGIHPDQAAAMFGYNSGAEMLHDISNAPPLKEVADANAEAAMVERHGDIMNDGTIERAADDAVKNEERGKLILQELKVLSRGTSVPTIDRMGIKAIAKEKIGELSFREIFPGKYRKAEIKASQEAAVALEAGDKQAAASAKMRQVMNYYLGMEASEAKAGTMKIVDRMSRYNKKKVREEIIKAEGGYWDQLNKILNRFEFRKSASLTSVENINTWMKEQVENEGAGLVLSNAVLDEGYITHWKNVPYTDLQGVNDSVKNIEHVARYSNKIDLLQEKVDFQKVVNDWVDSMNAKVEPKYKPTASVSDDPAKVVKWGRWAMAKMTKIPFLASWLDGGERVGMSHQLLVQRFTDAYDAEVRLWDETAKPVMDMILNRDKADIKRHNTKYYIPEIAGTAFHTGNMMGHEIIAVALNTGNQSNLRKLLLGEGWANPEVDTDISFQNPKLQAVLSKMTISDWQLVQTIWDQMDLLYPALAEVHRKTTGLTPPKIDKTPIEVQGMTFDGGYYPMKYDPSRDNRAQEQEDKLNAQTESMFFNTASIQASVNTSATEERTQYYAPIRLSLDVVQNHFQETIHYITHHDAVRQVNKLIRDNSVTNTIKEKLGPDEYNQLRPWLNDIAKDGREAPVKELLDPIFSRLRTGLTFIIMGFKASTGIIQTLGISNTIAEAGSSNTYQALRSVIGSPKDMIDAWGFASENSKVLNHRTKTMDREIKNAMSKLQDKRGILAAVQETSMKHIALIQTYMVDLPTWYAGYIKEMKINGDEQKAYQYGDWMVENIQGSGITKDMASFMRTRSESFATMSMFMTFFSSLWNTQRDVARGAKSKLYSKTTIAAKLMFLIIIPVILEMIMRGDFGGDNEPEEKLQRLLTNIALYPIATMPGIRDVASATFGEYGYNISPVASLVKKGTEAIPGFVKGVFTDEEITKSQLKTTSKATGAALKIPGINQAWATGEHLYEVLEEGEEFTFHQLLFGPRRD